jgi:hypothetical protein
MNTPPITGRAWKPTCFGSLVQYQCHRHALRRALQEEVHGLDDGGEILGRFRQARRPDAPVHLGVGLAIVQRQSITVLDLPVMGHFLARYGSREQVQAQDAVPHEVVLLAPRAGLVEGQSRVVVVGRHDDPAHGVLLGDLPIVGRLLPVAGHLAELRVGPQGENCLHRKVHVVGQVAGEVVGAELVLRIEALRLEELGPLGQSRPVPLGEVGVSFHLCQSRQDQEHVAALLDRHLIVLGLLAAAVDLAIGHGVRAQVVRGKRELPSRRDRIVQHRHQHGLRERGAEEEQLRGCRVDHVHCGNAAVAEVLLGEPQGQALGIGA